MKKRKLIDLEIETVEKYRKICFIKRINMKLLMELVVKKYADDWDESKPGKIY
jgi:hypothetical protein